MTASMLGVLAALEVGNLFVWKADEIDEILGKHWKKFSTFKTACQLMLAVKNQIL